MKAFLNFFFLLFIFYAFLCFLLYLFQERFIFFPERLEANHRFQFDGDFEEWKVPMADGKKLNALLFKAKQPKGVIFYLHGNAGSLKRWGEIAHIYTSLNYDFFTFDYRGFGKSEGKISSQAQLFEDNQLLYEKIAQKYPPSQIVVVGYSIGSGMAAKLAADHQPQKLILKAPYFSLSAVMKKSFPFIPAFLLKYPLPTHEFIENVSAPIVIFHGKKDEVIEFEHSIRLKEKQPNKIQLFALEKQGHNGINQHPLYQQKLARILAPDGVENSH